MAYRNVLRPSSPLSAKASTRCPSYACSHGAYPKGKSPNYECATRRRKPTRNSPPARNRIRQRCIIMTQPTVSSGEATALSGHPRSLILFTCQRSHTRLTGYLCSLSRISIGPGHRRSPSVTARPPGGGGRDRTDDLMLAKHALSQLSYAPTGKDQQEQWWAREDLNFRPHAYQARALTN